jgi:hypothetical protein
MALSKDKRVEVFLLCGSHSQRDAAQTFNTSHTEQPPKHAVKVCNVEHLQERIVTACSEITHKQSTKFIRTGKNV